MKTYCIVKQYTLSLFTYETKYQLIVNHSNFLTVLLSDFRINKFKLKLPSVFELIVILFSDLIF